MEKYLKLEQDDGTELYFQTVPIVSGGERVDAAAKGAGTAKAEDFLKKTLPAATTLARNTAERLRKDIEPDELEIAFSVGLSYDAKAVISSAGVNGGFTVKLKWKKPGNSEA